MQVTSDAHFGGRVAALHGAHDSAALCCRFGRHLIVVFRLCLQIRKVALQTLEVSPQCTKQLRAVFHDQEVIEKIPEMLCLPRQPKRDATPALDFHIRQKLSLGWCWNGEWGTGRREVLLVWSGV